MSNALRSSVVRAIAAAAVAAGCAACSTGTTTITQEWKSPSYAGGPMTNLLVVAARLDPTQRRTLEDGFASALSMHGVRATPSYSLFPDGMPDSKQARERVKKEGFDGVLVSVLRSLTEVTYVHVGVDYSGGFFDGYWGPGWATPPPPQTKEDVKFETTLWDPHGNGKLVWSAVTQTANPSTGRDFMTSLVHRIEPALVKDGLLPPAPGNRPAVSQRASASR
jgi:hypothetical protein